MGKKDKPVAGTEPGQHGFILQHPHGKKTGGKQNVEQKNRQKPEQNPADPVALFLLGGIRIFMPFIKHQTFP
jgi:hypothetical protein